MITVTTLFRVPVFKRVNIHTKVKISSIYMYFGIQFVQPKTCSREVTRYLYVSPHILHNLVLQLVPCPIPRVVPPLCVRYTNFLTQLYLPLFTKHLHSVRVVFNLTLHNSGLNRDRRALLSKAYYMYLY